MLQNIAHNLDEKDRTQDVLLKGNTTFSMLLLSTAVKNGLLDGGFKKPSPIQFKAIPLGRCGFDLIVKSKSGTGKTLVFSIISLETVNVTKSHLQVLILVPTREIAVQIQDVLRTIGLHINGLCIESFIGGTPLEEDLKKAKLCHIAVGAPGRVKHLINLGALSTKSVRLFVLDEADKLMESSFKDDINEIYDCLPHRKQIIATSATFPNELDTFLTKYMQSPTHVTSENETPLLLGLKQFVSVLTANTINAVQQMKRKNEMLVEIFSKISFTQCLVFTNYQSRTESVCNHLNQKGWTSSFISAAMDQSTRLEAINNLKNFKSRILLSTDLTSRGIDAPNVDLVINYDLPIDAVTYLHRMGRAGRYGSPGICINFACEGADIRKLELILGTIGATNLSIAKLPPLNGGCDLWQIDSGSLEQIWGVVPLETSEEISENIKKEVFNLKHLNTNKRSKNANKKTKLEECSKEYVEEILKKKKMDVDNVEASDCDRVLSSLINGDKAEKDFKFEGIKNENVDVKQAESQDVENLLSSLRSGTNSIEKKSASNKNAIFVKNKALLSTTKLLYNTSTQIGPDLIDSIDQYLQILKSQDNIAEVLSSQDVTIDPASTKTEDVQEIDAIENIFKVSYECALGEQTWLNHLPDHEIQAFQNFCRKEVEVSSEEDEDFEMKVEEDEEDEEEQETTESNDANDNIALRWVPVVDSQHSRLSNSDQFVKYYEDCGNVLWQTGLTFENVSEFDDWFYLWQEQLQSVRNYVQQNIYVEEMGKYQQSRLNK